MAKPSYALDPFYMSEFSDTDSDDSNLEPIDEQEIYGTFPLTQTASDPVSDAHTLPLFKIMLYKSTEVEVDSNGGFPRPTLLRSLSLALATSNVYVYPFHFQRSFLEQQDPLLGNAGDS